MTTANKKLFLSIISIASIGTVIYLGWHIGQPPAPHRTLLWPDDAPGALGNEPGDKPALTIYKTSYLLNFGTAVVICPGGAYAKLMTSYEGQAIAEWFNKIGVTAFVLEYRLAPRYHYPAPLEDALRAIRYVRANAAEFGIAPNRIGIMGFSAGGHLASTASTHYSIHSSTGDYIDSVSSRPDFTILGYPVISLQKNVTHEFSADNFLGGLSGSEEKRIEFSNHLQVNKNTPPAFLFHTQEDKPVPSENSILYYQALTRVGIPAELHIYEKGRHGAGLADGKFDAPEIRSLQSWRLLLKNWLISTGLLRKPEREAVPEASGRAAQ